MLNPVFKRKNMGDVYEHVKVDFQVCKMPPQSFISICAYQARSTWKHFFPVSARWPIMVLIHPTKEANGCQDWSQSEIPYWTLHPTCSFQSSDEHHNDDLTKKFNTNNNPNHSLFLCTTEKATRRLLSVDHIVTFSFRKCPLFFKYKWFLFVKCFKELCFQEEDVILVWANLGSKQLFAVLTTTF